MHHIAFQGPLSDTFAEARRLLRPGGALVAVEPGAWHPVGAGLALANRLGLGVAVHGTPDDIPLSPRKLAREARAVGLEPELHAVTYGWRRLPPAAQRAIHPGGRSRITPAPAGAGPHADVVARPRCLGAYPSRPAHPDDAVAAPLGPRRPRTHAPIGIGPSFRSADAGELGIDQRAEEMSRPGQIGVEPVEGEAGVGEQRCSFGVGWPRDVGSRAPRGRPCARPADAERRRAADRRRSEDVRRACNRPIAEHRSGSASTLMLASSGSCRPQSLSSHTSAEACGRVVSSSERTPWASTTINTASPPASTARPTRGVIRA